MHRIRARIIDKGPFTEKEAEVLRYMCEGLYSTEIALRLFRSPRTISKHIENIAIKLNARGSSEIVVIAINLGFIEISLINQPTLLKIILMLLLCNTFFPQDDARRPPRTPRASVVRFVHMNRVS
ncbi:LuxR C-terminal-related transcriptional regulator [Methylobacter sp. G7]|uniref:response regulator transcription factor n=1 Tax=Methylobacter sp. G7 TaxID=3230117 RepID=UPI003D806DDA